MERVRRGPPREAVHPELVRERVLSLPDRFRSDVSNGLVARFGLSIGDRGFHVTIRHGRCTAGEGEPLFPAARVETDADTWLALDEGREESIDAVLGGRLAVRGNVDLATRLQTMFRPSGRARLPADLDHATIRANGHALSAFVAGEGRPMVLLHGLGATKLSLLPIVRPLAERHRVIVPDLPGHGESPKPRVEYTPQFYESVVSKLIGRLDDGPAILIGNSMGGRIALEVAMRKPERVAGLILLDSAVPGFRWSWILQFMRVVPSEVAAVPIPIRRQLVLNAQRQLFAVPERLPPTAYEAGADEFVRVYRSFRARMALFSSLRGLVAPSPAFWQKLKRIRVPTLVVWGAEDRLVPSRLGSRLAGEIPSSELHILPSVGHVPQFEVPDVTTDLILGFLEARLAA